MAILAIRAASGSTATKAMAQIWQQCEKTHTSQMFIVSACCAAVLFPVLLLLRYWYPVEGAATAVHSCLQMACVRKHINTYRYMPHNSFWACSHLAGNTGLLAHHSRSHHSMSYEDACLLFVPVCLCCLFCVLRVCAVLLVAACLCCAARGLWAQSCVNNTNIKVEAGERVRKE